MGERRLRPAIYAYLRASVVTLIGIVIVIPALAWMLGLVMAALFPNLSVRWIGLVVVGGRFTLYCTVSLWWSWAAGKLPRLFRREDEPPAQHLV